MKTLLLAGICLFIVGCSTTPKALEPGKQVVPPAGCMDQRGQPSAEC